MQLERDGRFEVIAEAEDAARAVELMRDHKPDIASFDLHMDGMTNLEFLREARASSPYTSIVIVTGTYHPDHDPDLDLAEISGWFTKDQIMSGFADSLLELKHR